VVAWNGNPNQPNFRRPQAETRINQAGTKAAKSNYFATEMIPQSSGY
jgi:hypothetical protein